MLIGNLTRDPELRYTPSGTAVCTIGLATNRSWTPSDGGERQEETEFHRIVAWQKLAELCAQLLFKGRKVYVEGRLQTRNWTGKDGQERTTTEIVIDNMIVLDSRRKPGEEGGPLEDGEDEALKPASLKSQTQAADDDEDDSSSEPQEEKKEEVKEAKEEKKSASKKEKKAEPEAKEEKEEVKADDIPF